MSIAALAPLDGGAQPSHHGDDRGNAIKQKARAILRSRGMLPLGVLAVAVIFILIIGITLSSASRRPSSTSPAVSTSPSATPTVKELQEPHVVDEVGILTAADLAKLNRAIDEVENHSIAKIKIHIEPRLPPKQSEEEVALKIAESTFQPGEQNGIVIVAFLAERRVRIQVGRALRTVVTNEHAAEIIKSQIVPAFRQRAYADGLLNAVARLGELVSVR